MFTHNVCFLFYRIFAAKIKATIIVLLITKELYLQEDMIIWKKIPER